MTAYMAHIFNMLTVGTIQRAIALRCLILCTIMTFSSMQTQHAGAATPNKNISSKDSEVANMVLGILSYTKWQPPQSLIRLCLVAPTKYASQLDTIALPSEIPQLSISKMQYDVRALNEQCDVIYFGEIPPIQQQQVLNARKNKPVLTISEIDSNCEIGSIFCLNPGTSPVSFKINLDALAQSGIHINPNVLLLGRKKRGTP